MICTVLCDDMCCYHGYVIMWVILDDGIRGDLGDISPIVLQNVCIKGNKG